MKKLILFSLAFLLFAGCGKPDNKYVYVTIPHGANLNDIAKILKGQHVISNENTFKIIAKLEHKDKVLKSGIYRLKVHSSSREIITILAEGLSESVKITIPEGYTLKQIYGLLKGKFHISKTSFDNYTHDKTVLRHYGIKGHSLEGYLFPDTYMFSASSSLDEIIEKLLSHFNEIYASESTAYWSKLKRPRYKIIIMASLIQAEARFTSEMPVIASVYYNRLRKGYRLECDPTVIYAIGHHKNILTYKDLKINSPYNTYKYYGLPPGPICNPGKMAIRAALAPAKTDYLYFVANTDGHHLFAKSLREHEKNIRKVRKYKKSHRK